MTDDEIRILTQSALVKAMGTEAPTEIIVKSGFDHDGDAALFIDAILAPKAGLVPGEKSNSAIWSVRSSLVEKGELRFPYLNLKHPDDVYPDDSTVADRDRQATAS